MIGRPRRERFPPDGLDHLRFVRQSRRALESAGWTTRDALGGRFDILAEGPDQLCYFICWNGTRETLEFAFRTILEARARNSCVYCIIVGKPPPRDIEKSAPERGTLVFRFEDIPRIAASFAHARDLPEIASEQIRKGDLDAAEQTIRRALLFRPSNPGLIQRMSELLARRGDIKRAIVWAEWAARTNRSSPWPRYHLANLYLTAGDLDAAERTSREGLALDSSHTGLMQRLSEVERRRGHLDAARDLLVQAVSVDPSSPWLMYHLAGVLIAQDSLDEAEATVEKGRQLDATHSGLMQRRSEIARRRGDPEMATSWAERAVAADPQNPGLLQHLAGLYLQGDAVAAAERVLAQGLSISPGHAGLRRLRESVQSRAPPAGQSQPNRDVAIGSGS